MTIGKEKCSAQNGGSPENPKNTFGISRAIISLNIRWNQSNIDENGPTRPFSSISDAGGAVKVLDFLVRETRFYTESIRIKIAASEAAILILILSV